MNRLSLIGVLMFGMLVYASAIIFEKKGESYIQQVRENGGQLSTTIRTQDFQVLEFYTNQIEPETQLLDIVKDVKRIDGMEGLNAKLKLSLFSSKQEKFDTLLWQIKEDANDWAYLSDTRLLITKLSGCCGAWEGARAYNITTGKLIMSYTPIIEEVGSEFSPFVIEIPNTEILRFVGLLSADSSRDFPPELIEKDSQGFQGVAILKYTDKNSILQKFLIKVKVPEGFSANLGSAQWIVPENSRNEAQGGKVTLWDIDGQTEFSKIGGISLEIRVFSGSSDRVIKIPITSDKLDVTKAVKSDDVLVVPL